MFVCSVLTHLDLTLSFSNVCTYLVEWTVYHMNNTLSTAKDGSKNWFGEGEVSSTGVLIQGHNDKPTIHLL